MAKTNWIELIKNTGGKLSGSGFIGLLTGIVALGTFIAGTYLVFTSEKMGLDVMTTSAYLITIAGTLLGIRRFTTPKDDKNIQNTGGPTNIDSTPTI